LKQDVWHRRHKPRLGEDHPQHVFRRKSQEKFVYAQLLEYTQAQQPSGRQLFGVRLKILALSRHGLWLKET